MSDKLNLNRRQIMLAASAGVTAVTLSACSRTDDGGGDDGNGGLLEDAQGGGTIRIAYADENPYAYTGEDGNATGQSVAMHSYILEQLGIKADQIEWKQTEWGSLIPGLGTNHDMVIAGMFINPDRCERVAFAEPDYVMPDTLLVLAGNPLDLSDITSVAEHDSAVIGVMNGTTEHINVEAIGMPEERVNVQEDLSALILELKAGRCDAIALTQMNLQLEAEADDELATTDGFYPVDENGEEIIGAGAAVFSPADTDFRDAVNEELAKVLDDPELWLSLVEEFGFTIDLHFPPEDLTAEELCGGNYQ
ncbi:transporter substrate-binding domain-containing protein [Glycomyces arizonensis]|uniref:transporter substrate-binding domain-containing protein n=1 Tax=Glycomyces arizonensis TaxID=256035 RepID=UPI0006849711|nr:transporter substrate-binding domain-containing protein [Glycomyces arizonensis]